MTVPGILEFCVFSRRPTLTASRFIKGLHPKTAIPPTREAVKKVLDAGWWAQIKINGHRVQLHINATPDEPVLAFTRQGTPHTKALPAAVTAEVRRLFAPDSGWNVIDAEWDKPEDRIYAFDVLRFNGRMLDALPFQERFALLPRVYASGIVETLGIIRSLDRCMDILASDERKIEGLVFKAPASEGFQDSAILRCICPAHARH